MAKAHPRDPKIQSVPAPKGSPFVLYGYGSHRKDTAKWRPTKLEMDGLWRDLSTVMIVPTAGVTPTRVIDSWLSMIVPPNQKFARHYLGLMEVGAAYNMAIEQILADPYLSKFRYVLTLEEDNLPGPLDFVNLARRADAGNWDVYGGLYFTKGPAGVAQMWGEPPNDVDVDHFRPLDPIPGKVMRVFGTGMGFTLFKLALFRKIDGPWFQTRDGRVDGVWTQDLWFYNKLRQAGIKPKVGVDCRISIGHYDFDSGIIW